MALGPGGFAQGLLSGFQTITEAGQRNRALNLQEEQLAADEAARAQELRVKIQEATVANYHGRMEDLSARIANLANNFRTKRALNPQDPSLQKMREQIAMRVGTFNALANMRDPRTGEPFGTPYDIDPDMLPFQDELAGTAAKTLTEFQAVPTEALAARESVLAEAGREPIPQAAERAGAIAQATAEGKAAGEPAGGAGGPFEGTGLPAQIGNVIIGTANRLQRGETLTPEEINTYTFAYNEATKPRLINTPEGTFSVQLRLPREQFTPPEDLGKSTAASSVPTTEGGAEVTPVMPKGRGPEQGGKLAALVMGKDQAENVFNALVNPDGSINDDLMVSFMGNILYSEGRALRSQAEDAIRAKVRSETGATMREEELQDTIDRFIPSIFDSDSLKADKLKRFKEFFDQALEISSPELFKRLQERGGQE